MGTDKNLDAPTNVEVITYMEQEVLQVGKTNGFEGIFTTNTNPLTQVRLKGCIYFIKLEKYIFKLCIYCVYIYNIYICITFLATRSQRIRL